MSRPNLIACRRSLFQSVHPTTDPDSPLGPCSYTQHYCIAWLNILSLTLTTNVSLSRHRIKRFASVDISTKVSTCSKVAVKTFAALAFAKLADI